MAAVRELGFRGGLLVWAYGPDATATIRRLPDALAVYWTGDEPHPRDAELLSNVDAVLAVSPSAAELRRRQTKAPVFLMPMAVDPEPFVRARTVRAVPPELANLRRPILGYGGSISWRLDFDILRALAERRLGTVVLVGPIESPSARQAIDELVARWGVVWLGHRDAEQAPHYLASFDVGLIPYKRNRFNEGCNPVKFYEYLASGLKVVSTLIPALQPFQGVARFAEDPSAFGRAVELALAEGSNGTDTARRQAIARAHTFEALLARVNQVLLTLPRRRAAR